MTHKKFQLFNIVGAVVWVVLLIAAGYFPGNIPPIARPLKYDSVNWRQCCNRATDIKRCMEIV